MNESDLNMNVLDHFPEKYLKPHHLGSNNVIVTIKEFKKEEVFSQQRNKKEFKIVCYWHENLNPMVLNKGNSETLIKILKSNTLKSWINKKIILGTIPDSRYNERVVVRDELPKSVNKMEPKTAVDAVEPKTQYQKAIREILEVYTGDDLDLLKSTLNDHVQSKADDLNFYKASYQALIKSLRDQITSQFQSYLGDDYDDQKKKWIDGANVPNQKLPFFIEIAKSTKN